MTWQRFDWAEADPAFSKAIELNPSYAEARMFYSHCLTLTGNLEGGPESPYIGVGVKSEAIQNHPRFIQLLQDLKLDYWVEKYSRK